MESNITKVATTQHNKSIAPLLVGTSLALTSMILIPAFAMRLGLSASLTGALRMAAMKAGHQAMRG
ncbi:MAG: hypothetical protein WAX77_05510 [Methylococcaceae bacterium]